MPEHVLPAAFSDLEPFAAWALATETERNNKRLASSMAEIQAFYHAFLPRMDAVMDYLNQFPLDAMSDAVQKLMYMTLSLAEVSTAIELFKQPGVIDGYDPRRFTPIHKS